MSESGVMIGVRTEAKKVEFFSIKKVRSYCMVWTNFFGRKNEDIFRRILHPIMIPGLGYTQKKFSEQPSPPLLNCGAVGFAPPGSPKVCYCRRTFIFGSIVHLCKHSVKPNPHAQHQPAFFAPNSIDLPLQNS